MSVPGRREAVLGAAGVALGLLVVRPEPAVAAVVSFAQKIRAVLLPDGGHAVWTRQSDPGRLAVDGDVWLAP